MDKNSKYWIDSEFTMMHILMYIIIGMLADSTIGWIICGLLIFISVVYARKRVAVLPSDYLKVRK